MAKTERPLSDFVQQEFDAFLKRPQAPYRQWVLSVPFQLLFLFANRPEVMSKALGIVYRTIATHLVHAAGHMHETAHTGAITFIQRFGSALNLNVHRSRLGQPLLLAGG